MKRLHLDENWPDTLIESHAKRKFAKYYRLLRGIYPHIPAKAKFEFTPISDALADMWYSPNHVLMRFNSDDIKCYKLAVREFLHEMAHVIWPKAKHGEKFERRVFTLRRQLFHDSMTIY